MPVRELQDLGFGVHLVPLTRGKFALIDSADAEEVGRYNWMALKGSHGWYAVRFVERRGRRSCIYMHRQLMRAMPGIEVDHRDLDSLDNRRSNMRLATRGQNGSNRSVQRNNTSGFKGVCWDKAKQKWSSHIKVDGRQRFLGYFATPEEAHAAYAAAATKSFGEFARMA